jgi:uncharacterized protein (DUF1330 family)
MIATITVKDTAKFQEYLGKTQTVAAPYGAELLYRGKTGKALTGGAADHGLTVIVKFPSAAKIEAWYGSPEYQALVGLREAGADMRMVSYDVLS